MSAEYALKSHLSDIVQLQVSSAGTEAFQQEIHAAVRGRLLLRGIDPSSHKQTRLTPEILNASDLAIAMGRDHQEFILKNFKKEVLLFNLVAHNRDEPILDVHEVIPNWLAEPEKSKSYAEKVVDHICDSMPDFLRNFRKFIR